ncbi:MAG: hypothetical protein JO240_02035 [Solirubrobacterales bacterium]|nr:hypothetical protein [Solirubrobacterales bacterium]
MARESERGVLLAARSEAANDRVEDARAVTDAGLDLGVPDRAVLSFYA